ncbi:aminodeoxychorismate lyase [Ferrigenium kumadai]|uniref:aminodeoxychorismate lyase n=1 Tax=Ferrigenium kumadai TaxID=1682490 RepID=A0AAN1VZM6_9PROT|nr:aminodeoxychorismate lyase [Ferrigenium kumadai]BBI99589.1 aminodeoxychorismate lyase [Ferrigenium kumadai]
MLVNGIPGNTISIRDRGLLYGDGVFRTLRASQGKVQHWPLHYQKLQHDCHALGIACPSFDLLSAELGELLVRHPDGVVKLIVTRGLGMRGYVPPAGGEPTRIWDVSPLPQYPSDNVTRGIKARVCDLRLSAQPRLAGIKHLNRLENVLAAAEWDDAEIAEGLLLDADGHVIEGTRSNLFLVVHGGLVTPDLSRCGVAGGQRERVMAWAVQHNVSLQVRDVSLDEVLQADELFLVNSIIGLWPVRELQQRCWDAFPLAARIAQYLESGEA